MARDNESSLLRDKEIIQKKKFLNSIYFYFYEQLRPNNIPEGKVVELGSGAGFIKKVIPKTITSDVIGGPEIDKVFFAEKMPFGNKTVAAILMIDVFHHIKNVEKALTEMQRCLKVGGKIIMIEPYNSLWGGFIYKYIHHEHFDANSEWKVKGKGRMSDSNAALPWIVFERDRKIFETKFPELKILKIEPHTPFLYLLSGGLTNYQFIPTFLYPLARNLEKLLSSFNHWLGMFVTVELQKSRG